MSVTTGMVGAGFYDRNSATQWAAIEVVLPWLETAIATLPLADGSSPIMLADFGCSEGRNSIQVMQRMVGALRQRTSRPIQTIHSDLPTNDYRALFRDLRQDGRSVFGDNVFSAAVAGSMFDQLLPPRSSQLAMTYNAIGFLSRRPLDRLPGYILPNGPSVLRGVGEVTEDERRAFAAQAQADIASFLQARAVELVPGGKLLVEVFGVHGDARTCDGIYDALNDAVLEILEAGLIDRAGYENYYQPVYFRRLDELTAAVETLDAPLFRLDRAESYEVAVPFVEEFRRTGDAAIYAKSCTDFFRAFTESVLCAAFPASEPTRLASEVFGRAERLIREHPERYECRYASVAMLLTRSED